MSEEPNSSPEIEEEVVTPENQEEPIVKENEDLPPIIQRKPLSPRAQKAEDEKLRLNDALDHEYRYYVLLIPMLVGQLNAAEDKNKIIESVHLLVDPTICTEVSAVRTKRNRYLCMICIALLNNDVPLLIKMLNAVPKTISKKPSLAERSKRTKDGAIPFVEEPTTLHKQGLASGSFQRAIDPVLIPANKPKDPPAWEKQGDQQWEYYLGVIEESKKTDKKMTKAASKIPQRICSVHARECVVNKELTKYGTNLDQQFMYLLFLSIPFITQLENTMDLPCVWMQALCEVGRNACFEMKAIRNEYMNLLVGYLANKHICGPFEDLPTKPLEPLRAAANMIAEKRGLTGRDVPLNPLSGTVEAFMNEVPIIEEGAFAFLALTGNMIR